MKRYLNNKLCIPLFVLLLYSSAAATQDEAEKALRHALGAVIDNRINVALPAVNAMLADYPELTPAKMLHADLLTVHAHQTPLLGLPGASEKRRVLGILQETNARFTYRRPPAEQLPDRILQMSPHDSHAIVLDAAHSRLYLFKNHDGKPQLVGDYYVSTGYSGMGKTREGDGKTPLGIYHVTSSISDEDLPELYGGGAYPLNYPNAWDRLHGRSGYGIWLHGVPRNVGSRPPNDSRGCVILSNRLLTELEPHVDVKTTPVILSRQLRWLSADRWSVKRKHLIAAITRWQNDWRALDVEKYLAHYSRNYKTETLNYREMEAHTRRNAKKKTFVEVTIDKLSLFTYPGEAGMVMAIFDQDYKSNNYNVSYRKEQLWRNEDQGWKIIYEGRSDTAG